MSKKITERFQAIADEIERRQYDIVALQEVLALFVCVTKAAKEVA